MIITFGFLVLYTAVQPYCTPGLSKTQACSLIAQFISLFAGLCLVVESYVQRDLISAGEGDSTNQSTEAFGVLIIGFNLLITIWPIINVLVSGEFAENADNIYNKLKEVLKPVQTMKDSGGHESVTNSQQQGNSTAVANFNYIDENSTYKNVETDRIVFLSSSSDTERDPIPHAAVLG